MPVKHTGPRLALWFRPLLTPSHQGQKEKNSSSKKKTPGEQIQLKKMGGQVVFSSILPVGRSRTAGFKLASPGEGATLSGEDASPACRVTRGRKAQDSSGWPLSRAESTYLGPLSTCLEEAATLEVLPRTLLPNGVLCFS